MRGARAVAGALAAALALAGCGGAGDEEEAAVAPELRPASELLVEALKHARGVRSYRTAMRMQALGDSGAMIVVSGTFDSDPKGRKARGELDFERSASGPFVLKLTVAGGETYAQTVAVGAAGSDLDWFQASEPLLGHDVLLPAQLLGLARGQEQRVQDGGTDTIHGRRARRLLVKVPGERLVEQLGLTAATWHLLDTAGEPDVADTEETTARVDLWVDEEDHRLHRARIVVHFDTGFEPEELASVTLDVRGENVSLAGVRPPEEPERLERDEIDV